MGMLAGYSQRRQINIDHTKVNADLIDFPLTVFLTSTNFDFSQSNLDGKDIRFTSSDGETLLIFRWKYHDSSAQKACYFVKVPVVSCTDDTIIYLYFRNISTDDGSISSLNLSYNIGWWDLNNNWLDFSGVGNHGSAYYNPTFVINTELGGYAASFDGIDDGMTASASINLGYNDLSMEAWVKPLSYGCIIGKNDWPGPSWPGWSIYVDSTYIQVYLGTSSKTGLNITFPINISFNNWHHIALSIDRDNSSGIVCCVDGNIVGVGDPTSKSGYISTTRALTIGINYIKYGPLSDHALQGSIYGVVLYTDVKSDAWKKARYASGNNTLLTFVLAIPTNFNISNILANRITLVWNDVIGETGFKIERRPIGGTWSPIAEVGANVISYEDNTFDLDNIYEYRVKAITSLGDSDGSNSKIYKPVMKVSKGMVV